MICVQHEIIPMTNVSRRVFGAARRSDASFSASVRSVAVPLLASCTRCASHLSAEVRLSTSFLRMLCTLWLVPAGQSHWQPGARDQKEPCWHWSPQDTRLLLEGEDAGVLLQQLATDWRVHLAGRGVNGWFVSVFLTCSTE